MLIVLGLLGGVALTTSAWVVVERNQPEPETINVEDIVKSTIALHKPSEHLTQPDLLKVPCSSDYIVTNGDLLGS